MTTQIRRIFGVAMTAAALAGASLMSLASPAHAATNHVITWDCTANDIPVTASVGDTLTFSIGPGCFIPGFVTAYGYLPPAPPGTLGYTERLGQLAWGNVDLTTAIVTIVGNNGSSPIATGKTIAWMDDGWGTLAKIVITLAGGGAGPSDRPAPVLQGLPMPVSGLCSDVRDANYAWGTGLTGGWQKSWQPWAGPAANSIGGWACIRTLVNTGDDTWVIDNGS